MKERIWHFWFLLAISVFVWSFGFGCGVASAREDFNAFLDRIYPEAITITELQESEDKVYGATSTNNVFHFVGIEDYVVGDEVAVIMDNMGTSRVSDDEIWRHKYVR